MRNPSSTILDKAVVLRLRGEKWPAVLEATGLSHSQAENHEMRFKMWLHAAGVPGFSEWTPIVLDADPATAGAQIADQRSKGVSWGAIGVRAGVPESKVRRLFKEATNVHSEGQRIGKGGRWLDNREDFYSVDPAHGTLIPGDMSWKGVELTEAGTVRGIKAPQRQAITAWAKALGMEKARESRKAKG